jgi:hypothetical protein
MLRGMYSIIRYSNDLNDQRVNLGVVVWHPVDGFSLRTAPTLSRAQAINSTVDLDDVAEQIRDITRDIGSQDRVHGEFLDDLSKRYRDGLVVSAPYPARMYSASVTLDRLYDLLITPKGTAQPRREQFDQSVKMAIKTTVSKSTGFHYKEHGKFPINGISVDLGTEVSRGQNHSLWRSIALHFNQSASAQMAKTKAAAMDVVTITNEVPKYSRFTQFVAVQALNASADQRDQAASWLRHANAEAVIVGSTEELSGKIAEKLAKL